MNKKLKKSILWQIYFFIIVVMTVTGITGILLLEGAGIMEYLYATSTTIATIGLFGYVFSRPIFYRAFWLGFSIIYIVFNIAYYFLTNIDLSTGLSETEYVISTIIGILFTLPAYTGLFLYGRPATKLWDSNA